MKQCPVLELVELMARTMEDFRKHKIGEKVYEGIIKDFRYKIDTAVIENCPVGDENDDN